MAISKEDYLEGYSKAFDLIQNSRSKDVIKSAIGSFINSTNDLMGKYFLTNFETDGVIAMVSCIDEKIHRVFPNMRICETDPKACDGQMFMLLVSEDKEEPVNGQGAGNVLPLSEADKAEIHEICAPYVEEYNERHMARSLENPSPECKPNIRGSL